MILYNPKNGTAIGKFPKEWWLGDNPTLEVNEMKEFDDSLGQYLLDKFGFLIEVTPSNIIKLKKEMEKPEPASEEEKRDLEYANLSEPQKKALESVPKFVTKNKMRTPKMSRMQTPEESAGIPVSGKDKDQVEWYGPGLEDDAPAITPGMELRIPGATKGVFAG
jgi:hypothetical protein